MTVEEARSILADSDEIEDPVTLPTAVLAKLDINSLPDGGTFQIGALKDGVHHVEWSGKIGRDGSVLFGEADLTWTRKPWYSPLGLEQYLDLVRRAVEIRHPHCLDLEHDRIPPKLIPYSMSFQGGERERRSANLFALNSGKKAR